jgi:hypothetical protein
MHSFTIASKSRSMYSIQSSRVNSSHPLLAPRTGLSPKTDKQPSIRKPTQAKYSSTMPRTRQQGKEHTQTTMSPKLPGSTTFLPFIPEGTNGPV